LISHFSNCVSFERFFECFVRKQNKNFFDGFKSWQLSELDFESFSYWVPNSDAHSPNFRAPFCKFIITLHLHWVFVTVNFTVFFFCNYCKVKDDLITNLFVSTNLSLTNT
jgi:hypothetical protein